MVLRLRDLGSASLVKTAQRGVDEALGAVAVREITRLAAALAGSADGFYLNDRVGGKHEALSVAAAARRGSRRVFCRVCEASLRLPGCRQANAGSR